MNQRFPTMHAEFQKVLNKSSNGDPLTSEVFDLAEYIRCEALELEKAIKNEYESSIKRGYPMEKLELQQPLYRLRDLYKELTGISVDEFFEKMEEEKS